MSDSLLKNLLKDLPNLRSQTYFKSSLIALSHAMEDLILVGDEAPLVIANFQRERFYRQEIRRYQQIAQRTEQVYVLAAPEPESGFAIDTAAYDVIPLHPDDALTQEWHLVIIGKHHSACLICREQIETDASVDQMRTFEGVWTFDPSVSSHAARWLLGRIATYRPELTDKIERAQQQYSLTSTASNQALLRSKEYETDTDIFGQRLVTYLQAGQYKLLKTYQKVTVQEQRERLINTLAVTIRNSLDPHAVLLTTVQALGQTFSHCRCLLYRCHSTDSQITIDYEFAGSDVSSLSGERWSLADNPLIQVAMAQDRAIVINDTAKASNFQKNHTLQSTIQCWQIRSWLLVPIRYQGTLVGMIELHASETDPSGWQEHDILFIEAIATQAGFALTQAQAYADLETLNRQLAMVEQTQRNLIAIVGHELRTPLSTIQVCLESIATEPDMPAEFLQTMLDTALTDADRMRKLIQNFLTLSRLETGKSILCLESIQIQETIHMALNSVKTSSGQLSLPSINVELPTELPSVKADGESLVKVVTELLENACKFTEPDGEITIHAGLRRGETTMGATIQDPNDSHTPVVEVTVADTGRGIEPSQLETVFDWFSQEEDFLRRTVGGAGLGLAICRQLVQRMGGLVWAESTGKDQGSKFHFTVPIEVPVQYQNSVLA
ncbi:GAF domain-containing protein [Leptolyngbya cf. ectocarpi LEGE 11479]|uniref:histidine kinase n=1 Tax=Leptolyngbya cf. ectocarpi LEGE 11479 TaxID=1828722 RepID=A0A928X2R9_LEPEC|nr:DICT sensory domain-containing protein [Leptolyngbya ectocarpi]MBE9065483.1 GAF domain-containing protein [Leptolyngbya cf. ectocarpi LEGE 11479]